MKNLTKYFFTTSLFLSAFLFNLQIANAQENISEDPSAISNADLEVKEYTTDEGSVLGNETKKDSTEENLMGASEEKNDLENKGIVDGIIDFVQETFGGNDGEKEETANPNENIGEPNQENIPVEETPVVVEDLTLFEELKIEVLNIMEEITDFFTVDTREEVVIEPRREVEIEKENIDYTNTSDSCKADPFLVDISNGMKTTTIYTIDTKAREITRKIQIGDLPQGIDVKFGSNNSYSKNVKDGETKFILEIKKEDGDQKGSFNIPIIYTVGESKVICQISVSNY